MPPCLQVLIRIMEFLTTIDIEHNDLFFMKVEGLAKIHSKRTIRPWMYSCFIETLTTTGKKSVLLYACGQDMVMSHRFDVHETVSFCLEEKATYEVATAWTHLGAYVLRALLPGAIKVNNRGLCPAAIPQIMPLRSDPPLMTLVCCRILSSRLKVIRIPSVEILMR